MSDEVCSHYNVGYCKQKNECSKFHPSEDCENKCKEKTCLKRHRRICRDTESCIYHKSNTCEFIHEVKMDNKESQIHLLTQENKELREEIINKNILIEKLSKDMANILMRVEALEKEKSLNVIQSNYNANTQVVESSWIFSSNNVTNAINDDSDELNCYICKKGFYSNKELRDHNNLIHEGNKSNELLKCKNCSEKFKEKSELENHIKIQHATCSLCDQVYSTKESLIFHISAVHEKVNNKHVLEKEPSFKNHKLKRTDP